MKIEVKTKKTNFIKIEMPKSKKSNSKVKAVFYNAINNILIFEFNSISALNKKLFFQF